MKTRKIALLALLSMAVCSSTILSGCTTTSSDTDDTTAYIENLDTIGSGGDIQVEFTLVDDEDDTTDLQIEYCTIDDYVSNGHDATWTTATMLDGEDGDSATLDDVYAGSFTMYWDSDTDLPSVNDDYVLRVMPGTSAEEYSDTDGPISIYNAAE